MAMNRKQIEEVAGLCMELQAACTKAMEQIDHERIQRAYWQQDGEPAEPSPGDQSYGSRATGALRRKSMDMTRALADLRRS